MFSGCTGWMAEAVDRRAENWEGKKDMFYKKKNPETYFQALISLPLTKKMFNTMYYILFCCDLWIFFMIYKNLSKIAGKIVSFSFIYMSCRHLRFMLTTCIYFYFLNE